MARPARYPAAMKPNKPERMIACQPADPTPILPRTRAHLDPRTDMLPWCTVLSLPPAAPRRAELVPEPGASVFDLSVSTNLALGISAKIFERQ